eukprot:391709-Prymnesium_polylepis.1
MASGVRLMVTTQSPLGEMAAATGPLNVCVPPDTCLELSLGTLCMMADRRAGASYVDSCFTKTRTVSPPRVGEHVSSCAYSHREPTSSSSQTFSSRE